MTHQEFGAILFIGLSLFAGAVVLLIRQADADFLPDLAGYDSPDSSIVQPIQETKAYAHSPAFPTPSAGPSESPDKNAESIVSFPLNTASLQDLQNLPGIGPELARRIVLYRQKIGVFTALEQLLDVKGIGPAKLARLKPYISFH